MYISIDVDYQTEIFVDCEWEVLLYTSILKSIKVESIL